MNKYIPLDYLICCAAGIPACFKLAYFDILENAPAISMQKTTRSMEMNELYEDAYDLGYEYGFKDGFEAGFFGVPSETSKETRQKRRRIKQ